MRAILPKPVSTNHIYKFTSRGGFARSYISKAGQDWFTEAGYLVKNQIKERGITANLEVFIQFWTARANDVDSCNKSTLDLLQKTGIIVNDRQVKDLRTKIFRAKHIKDEKLILEIKIID